MAWNQSGDKSSGPNGPNGSNGKPRRAGATAPSGMSPWRRWRQRLTDPNTRGSVLAGLLGAACVAWLGSGLYQIEDGERGVLQRFGAFEGTRGSGLGWHLPWPIESMTAVNLAKLNSAEVQARLPTHDAVLVNVTASFHYRYLDARAALFAAREPDAIIRELAEAAMRELAGQRSIAELMAGAGRAELAEALRTKVQEPIDVLALGVRVLDVELTSVQVPEAVLAAQRDNVQSGVERDRVRSEAEGYAAELIPTAQGTAQRQHLDAEAYKLQVIGQAQGEAARFEPLAAVYARAPEVTRKRLYIETMETILARSRKLIIDGKSGGNSLVLPLDKLSDAGALRAAGVVGGVAAPAPASGPNLAVATPSPAVAPPVASPVASPSAADNTLRSDRSRERGERR